ncbi:MAG: nitroreductase family protein, partial [Bacteroidales bacterium]|nr:nitroreductase family protein [Bacteroidales bacterium]
MKSQNDRRSFLKTSALVGSGIALSQAKLLEAKEEIKPTNDTLKTLHKLRTIHGNFTDKPVPDDKIEQILQASVRAANASNMQSYSIIVVKDRAKMKKVCQYQGGCLLLYCIDHNRIKASAEALGHSYHADNATNFVTASINAAFAAQTAVIAARSLGLDCLTTNGIHRGKMDRVWRLLNLPEKGCFPLIAVV